MGVVNVVDADADADADVAAIVKGKNKQTEMMIKYGV